MLLERVGRFYRGKGQNKGQIKGLLVLCAMHVSSFTRHFSLWAYINGGRQANACRPPFYSWGSFGSFAQEAMQECHDLGAGAVITGGKGGGGSAAGDPVLNGPHHSIVVVHLPSSDGENQPERTAVSIMTVLICC